MREDGKQKDGADNVFRTTERGRKVAAAYRHRRDDRESVGKRETQKTTDRLGKGHPGSRRCLDSRRLFTKHD